MPYNTIKNMEIQIFTTRQYADKVAKCHINTLQTKISKELLPSNHIVFKAKQTIIVIVPKSGQEFCKDVEDACIEFNRLCGVGVRLNSEQTDFKRQLAAEISIKYNINTNKFFKMQGL